MQVKGKAVKKAVKKAEPANDFEMLTPPSLSERRIQFG